MVGKLPSQPDAQDTAPLTKLQKVAGVCLLVFYLAMIAITIATLPYTAGVDAGALPMFWQWRNSATQG